MRTIKFRFYSNHLHNFVVPDDSIFVGALKDPDMNPQQFTGLLDRNGVEIYEHDLVEQQGGKRGTIVFYGGCFCWENKDTTITELTKLSPASHYEVIGNIYETKS